jgi:hypothetical protein
MWRSPSLHVAPPSPTRTHPDDFPTEDAEHQQSDCEVNDNNLVPVAVKGTLEDDEDDDDELHADYVPPELASFVEQARHTLHSTRRSFLQVDGAVSTGFDDEMEDAPLEHGAPREDDHDIRLQQQVMARYRQPSLRQSPETFLSPELTRSPPPNPTRDLTDSQAKQMALAGTSPGPGGATPHTTIAGSSRGPYTPGLTTPSTRGFHPRDKHATAVHTDLSPEKMKEDENVQVMEEDALDLLNDPFPAAEAAPWGQNHSGTPEDPVNLLALSTDPTPHPPQLWSSPKNTSPDVAMTSPALSTVSHMGEVDETPLQPVSSSPRARQQPQASSHSPQKVAVSSSLASPPAPVPRVSAADAARVVSRIQQDFAGAQTVDELASTVRVSLYPYFGKRSSPKSSAPVTTTKVATCFCDEQGDASTLVPTLAGLYDTHLQIGGRLAGALDRTAWGTLMEHTKAEENCLLVYGPSVTVNEQGDVMSCGKSTQAWEYTQHVVSGLAAPEHHSATPVDIPADAQTVYSHMLLPYWQHLLASSQSEATSVAIELPYAAFAADDNALRHVIQQGAQDLADKGKLAILGGIQIVTPAGLSDYFLPLRFQILSSQAEPLQTFVKVRPRAQKADLPAPTPPPTKSQPQVRSVSPTQTSPSSRQKTSPKEAPASHCRMASPTSASSPTSQLVSKARKRPQSGENSESQPRRSPGVSSRLLQGTTASRARQEAASKTPSTPSFSSRLTQRANASRAQRSTSSPNAQNRLLQGTASSRSKAKRPMHNATETEVMQSSADAADYVASVQVDPSGRSNPSPPTGNAADLVFRETRGSPKTNTVQPSPHLQPPSTVVLSPPAPVYSPPTTDIHVPSSAARQAAEAAACLQHQRDAASSRFMQATEVSSKRNIPSAESTDRLVSGAAMASSRNYVQPRASRLSEPLGRQKPAVSTRLLKSTAASHARHINEANGTARDRIRQRMQAHQRMQQPEAPPVKKTPRVSAAEGVAKARERVRQRQLQQQQTADKENGSRRNSGVPRARLSIDIQKSARQPSTIPKTPNFATNARYGRRSVVRSVEEPTSAQQLSSFGKGLREEKSLPPRTTGSGRPPLTVPKAPKFATTARHGEKEITRVKDTTLAQSSETHMKGLRDDTSIGSTSSTKRHGLTIPQAPHFATNDRYGERISTPGGSKEHRSSHPTEFFTKGLRESTPFSNEKHEPKLTIPRAPKFHKTTVRELPQSTADKEQAMIDYVKSHPYRAKPIQTHANAGTKKTSHKLANRKSTMPIPFSFRSEQRAVSFKPSTGSPNREEDLKELNKKFKARPMPVFVQPIEASKPARVYTSPEPFEFSIDKRIHKEKKNLVVNVDEEELAKQFRARPSPKSTWEAPAAKLKSPTESSTNASSPTSGTLPQFATAQQSARREAAAEASRARSEKLSLERELQAKERQARIHNLAMKQVQATRKIPSPPSKPFVLESSVRHEAHQRQQEEKLRQEEERRHKERLFKARAFKSLPPPDATPLRQHKHTTPQPFQLESLSRHQTFTDERSKSLQAAEEEQRRLSTFKAKRVPASTYTPPQRSPRAPSASPTSSVSPPNLESTKRALVRKAYDEEVERKRLAREAIERATAERRETEEEEELQERRRLPVSQGGMIPTATTIRAGFWDNASPNDVVSED